MDLVVFGDSHAVALGRGLSSLKDKGVTFAYDISVAKIFSAPQVNKEFHRAEGDRILITGEARAEFEKLMGRDYLGPEDRQSVFACSIGFTTTKFYRHDMWKKYTLKARTGKRHVTECVTSAMFLHYNRYSLDFYKQVRRIGLRCVAVVPPPPQPEDPAVGEAFEADEMLAVDQVCRKALETELGKFGISCVPPPASVYTEKGFLKPEYSHERQSDFHHGNLQYGELMLEALMKDVAARYA